MELNITSPAVEKSAEFKEEFFGMGNLAVVMTILRSKLYSNPIKTVVQEILSNARDAHREVNKADIPVEVTLPSVFNPNFEVKDFGPGISPERMSDVFLQYGNSTKRSDNLQTGGFGLGAKSPFSYTDSFVIESITDSKKRVYVAYIDETSIGKMSLISVENTTESNGTTIKIPVKQEDFSEFESNYRDVTEYWDVRPEVENTIWYSNPDSFKNKDDFFWFENCYSQNIKILIDKIPYFLPRNAIYSVDFSKYDITAETCQTFFNLGFCMEVPCGELTVSANREQVEINDKNLKVLFYYFNIANEKLASKYQADIDNRENYIEAIKYISETDTLYKHLSENNTFSFRGCEFPKDFKFSFKNSAFHVKLYEGKSYFPNKINLTAFETKAILDKNSKPPKFVVCDDYSRINKKIKKLVEQNPKTDFIFLHAKQALVESATDPKFACALYVNEFLKEYGGMEEYTVLYLSDLEYDKTPRVKRGSRPAKNELELVCYRNGGVSSTTEDILQDPEFKLYYICTRYSKVVSAHGQQYDKEDFLYRLRETILSLIPATSTEKIAIFSCNQKTFNKYNTASNDIENFIRSLYLQKFSHFQLHEITRHHAFSGNRPIVYYFRNEGFWIYFQQHNTVKNPFIKSLIEHYNKFHYANDRSETWFLRHYGSFLGLGEGGNSTFYECLYKTFESYPLLPCIQFNQLNLRTDSDCAEITKKLSDYINLCDSVKNSCS